MDRLVNKTLLFLIASFIAAGMLSLTEAQTAPSSSAAMPAGQRVFYASHSLMWDMPPVLTQQVEAYGIKGHTVVGLQRIGVSRTIQHWNLPDAQNQAKQALQAGNVDVFVTSNLVHPDEGIDNFFKLGRQHNPNMRFLMQISWPGLGNTDNEQFNAGRGAAPGAGAGAAPAGGGGRGGLGARGGMFLSGNDEKTPEQLTTINAIDIKNAEEQARRLNAEAGKPVVFLVPTAQAHNALRTLIYKKEVPGMAAQSEVFIDPIGHPTAPVIALNAYLHFSVLYKRSPVGLPMPTILKNANRPQWNDEKLNRKLQELAWDIVRNYPPSGVTADAR